MWSIILRLLALLFATLALWMQALELLLAGAVEPAPIGYWHGRLLVK